MLDELVVCFIEPHTDRQTCCFFSWDGAEQRCCCFFIISVIWFPVKWSSLFVLFISLAIVLLYEPSMERERERERKSQQNASTCLVERLNNAMESRECFNFFFAFNQRVFVRRDEAWDFVARHRTTSFGWISSLELARESLKCQKIVSFRPLKRLFFCVGRNRVSLPPSKCFVFHDEFFPFTALTVNKNRSDRYF